MRKYVKKISLLTILLMSLTVYAEPQVLRMSTTTSTENSGLLTVLNPPFEQQYNIRLDVISVGTGKALRLGANGDVDIVFVHAPKAEMAYVKQGFFIDRKAVMHNDFVLLGPQSDPAHIKQAKTTAEALQLIATGQANFISRGDDSGTDKKEQALWQSLEFNPKGQAWYQAVGQGMGAVLQIANEQQAYTLSDRGTFIAYQNKLDLVVLFEGEKTLFNPYHIMAVNPEKYPTTQYLSAKRYIDYVTSDQGQRIINHYQKSGQQLFYPDAINNGD